MLSSQFDDNEFKIRIFQTNLSSDLEWVISTLHPPKTWHVVPHVPENQVYFVIMRKKCHHCLTLAKRYLEWCSLLHLWSWSGLSSPGTWQVVKSNENCIFIIQTINYLGRVCLWSLATPVRCQRASNLKAILYYFQNQSPPF